MPTCEFLDECMIYSRRMRMMPTVEDVYKKKYCTGSYTECVRYIILKALGEKALPYDLLPGDKKRAQEILDDTAEEL